MTEPDGSPAEDLRTRVAGLEAVLHSIATGFTTDVAALEDSILALEERLAGLGAAPPTAAAPVKPAAWVDVATPEDWATLAAWVDWLTRTYDLELGRTILPCWPAHLGAAEELAALHAAWKLAATSARTTAAENALSVWHERSLHPTLIRLRAGYALGKCTTGDHRETKVESDYTDTRRLDTAANRDRLPAVDGGGDVWRDTGAGPRYGTH